MSLRVFLLCSLTANVMLATSVAYIFQQVPKSVDAPPFITRPSPAKPEARTGDAGLERAAAATERVVLFDWHRVESSDYQQYITNLRAIGCPEETIRDIIVADVKKLFAARGRQHATNRFEYWKGGSALGNLLDEQTIARQQELGREKRELLKTLLGSEAPIELESSFSAVGIYEAMVSFLPSEKQNQVKELEESYAGKMLRQGDAGAMRAVQTEKDAELLKLLGPEDKFEYDLRLSHTATLMRMQMGDLQLSEPEFRELFRLRKALDDGFGSEGRNPAGAPEQQKRDAARKDMNSKVASLLGDRYPEYKYEMSGEWAAQMLHRVARENNISRENALKAYQVTDLARVQAESADTGAGQLEGSKDARLKSIYHETVQALTQVLGQQAADAYLKKVALIPGFKTADR